MDSTVDNRLKGELESFQKLWQGGYFEGQPMDPLATSAYLQLGFHQHPPCDLSALHQAVHQARNRSVGDWPRKGSLDAVPAAVETGLCSGCLSAEHNGFFEYLGHPRNVKYFQVQDFKCEPLPDNSFDFMFSHGCLCHVSFDGISQYARHIYPKMKSGSDCFWMVADYEKYNAAYATQSIWDSLGKSVPPQGKPLIAQLKQMTEKIHRVSLDEDLQPAPGRWFNAGIKRTCAMLEAVGYKIVDPDVGTNLRDPIIQFRKP